MQNERIWQFGYPGIQKTEIPPTTHIHILVIYISLLTCSIKMGMNYLLSFPGGSFSLQKRSYNLFKDDGMSRPFRHPEVFILLIGAVVHGDISATIPWYGLPIRSAVNIMNGSAAATLLASSANFRHEPYPFGLEFAHTGKRHWIGSWSSRKSSGSKTKQNWDVVKGLNF